MTRSRSRSRPSARVLGALALAAPALLASPVAPALAAGSPATGAAATRASAPTAAAVPAAPVAAAAGPTPSVVPPPSAPTGVPPAADANAIGAGAAPPRTPLTRVLPPAAAGSKDVAPIPPGTAPGPIPPGSASPGQAFPGEGASAAPAPAKPPAMAPVSRDPVPTLAPSTFVDTMRAAERYGAIAEAGGWPALPPGTVLRPGEHGPLVVALRAHLALTGDLAPAAAGTPTPGGGAAGAVPGDLFDAGLTSAVRGFQARHGLPESGFVGARTLDALNVPAAARQRQLAASAARLMGSTFPFGERYVVVNIPSATAEAVERGAVAHRYVAVVGKADRATPEVATRVTNVNFHPTWTVPASLVRKDIIPHVRQDPAYLAKMRIRVLDAAGREVDPAAIDWSTNRAADFTLRQDPGATNSLGQVRVDMPNRHAVYMHDTPSKRLFAGAARFHSSGCVRVAEIDLLVAWLLEGTLGPDGTPFGHAAVAAAIAGTERRDVKLAKPVPVAFVYLTGYATPDGRAHFRDDPYGLDLPRPRTIEEALTTGSLADRQGNARATPSGGADALAPRARAPGIAAPDHRTP